MHGESDPAGEDQKDPVRFSRIRGVSLDGVCIERSGSEGANQTCRILGRDERHRVDRVDDVSVRGLEVDSRAGGGADGFDIELNPWARGLSWG
jgi:hypothetical protein